MIKIQKWKENLLKKLGCFMGRERTQTKLWKFQYFSFETLPYRFFYDLTRNVISLNSIHKDTTILI